jgi:uncharacterized protein YbaA (DUF1428 family)
MIQHTTLSILQYNVRKSRDMVMATLLRDPRIHEYDILAITVRNKQFNQS